MSKDSIADNAEYCVVINQEEQYSIWSAYKEMAPGWLAVGKQGNEEQCLAYIRQVWTDMRPKTLRDKLNRALQVP